MFKRFDSEFCVKIDLGLVILLQDGYFGTRIMFLFPFLFFFGFIYIRYVDFSGITVFVFVKCYTSSSVYGFCLLACIEKIVWGILSLK